MKSFDIEITETLQRTVSVIADSREEAEQMVDDGWHNGDYVLDSEDFIDVDFKTVGEKEMSKDKKELDVLLVKPNEYPQKVTIGAELKDLQEAVGGTITATYVKNGFGIFYPHIICTLQKKEAPIARNLLLGCGPRKYPQHDHCI